MTVHLMCVYINLVWFELLSGHLLGESCSLGYSYILFVFCLIVFIILVISRFGFEGGILIAPVPSQGGPRCRVGKVAVFQRS